jgi:hypothetical protein
MAGNLRTGFGPGAGFPERMGLQCFVKGRLVSVSAKITWHFLKRDEILLIQAALNLNRGGGYVYIAPL